MRRRRRNPTATPQTIQRNTYGTLLNQYGISTTDELQPPDPTACVQVAFSQNVPQPDDDKTMAFSSNEFKIADIPKGYKATRDGLRYPLPIGHPESTGADDQVAISVNVGNVCLMFDELNEFASGGCHCRTRTGSASGNTAMNGEEGVLTVALAGFSTLAFSFSGSISIICNLTDEAFEKWQTQIYNLIMADYNRKLDAYNASNNKNDQLFQIKGSNPFLNREIERNEFKRHIIAMLLCNYFNGIGSMMEHVRPAATRRSISRSSRRTRRSSSSSSRCSSGNYVNYLFYHSMWARKCKWPELIDEDSGDPLFDKFLMAGAARVQVRSGTGWKRSSAGS